MTLTMDQMGQNPALEGFLRAIVGQDVNGSDVSVISMLARLEVDPWHEACDLAAMPDAPARKRLNDLMTRFEDVPTLARDQGKVVSTLLDLLPRKKAAASTEPGDVVPSLLALAMHIPLLWYAVAFIALGWINYLAQGQ